jgi:2-deoxy-D-gluconate 3-dehydrogenase
MKLFDLTGKVAIVTGGNGGIGLGMARGLAGAGATVVLSGRNAEKGDKAARALGGECIFISADVTRKAACQKLVADTVAKFGRLDILVNNAGIAIRKNPAPSCAARPPTRKW